MLILFWLLFFIKAEENELGDFINIPIKIFFAAYGSTFLGIDTKSHNLVARNKYIDFGKHNFDPIGKIVKNGELHEIYYGGSKICKMGSIISQCENEGGWKLSRTNFGFTISKNSSCITKDRNDTVSLKKCTESDDQIFMFKAVNDLGDCAIKEALDTEDKHKININVIPVTKSESDQVKIKGVRNVTTSNDYHKEDKIKIFSDKNAYTLKNNYKVTNFDDI